MSALPHVDPAAHLDIEPAGQMRRLGVFLVILGDSTFVLSLVFTYLYLRSLNTEGKWLAADQPGPVSTGYSWLIGLVAVLSWLVYRWAQDDRREMSVLRAGVLVASLIAVVDLGLQVAQMVGAGFTPRDGAYQSAWMALAGYHVVHLLLTLFLGTGILVRAAKGRFDHDRWHIRLVGYWWTWMAVSAILITATTSLTAASR